MRFGAAALAVAVGVMTATDALADTASSAAKAADLPATFKSERLAAKDAVKPDPAAKRAWQKRLDARIGKQPVEVINVYNTWTREFVAVDRTPKQTLPKEQVNRFLRCHFTNEPTQMDPALFPKLIDAARHFRADRINIVSGFRAPKYNLILRKKGRGVARNSQHPKGNAVDFRIPGVPTRRLREWVRKQKLGGVGFYPSSGFIHMDTGRVRTWTGR